MLKARLNGKAVDRTKRDKINKKNEWFTLCCLRSYELQFLNIFSASEADILRSVELLHHIC